MYTLDQQIKDVDQALEALEFYERRYYTGYLCSIAKAINTDFYDFIVRAFKRMDKVSPKAYKTTISNPLSFSVSNRGFSPALWDGEDFASRKQFLEDLKEDIIENG